MHAIAVTTDAGKKATAAHSHRREERRPSTSPLPSSSPRHRLLLGKKMKACLHDHLCMAFPYCRTGLAPVRGWELHVPTCVSRNMSTRQHLRKNIEGATPDQ